MIVLASRLRDVVSVLTEDFAGSEDPDELLLLIVVAAAKALQSRRERRRTGPKGRDDDQEWIEPETACAEFGLDPRRLARRWRQLAFCSPRAEGGRGFRVNRHALRKHLAARRGL